MTLKQTLLAAIAGLALSSAANAITWTDRDPNSGNGPLQFLAENGTLTYSSTFDITAAGFVPGTHTVDTINVSFAFADDSSDDAESMDIFVGGIKIWNDLEVDGDHSNAPISYQWFSQSLTGNLTILGDLNTDGIVSYQVTIQNLLPSWNDKEDAYLKIAELTAEGHTIPEHTPGVPDGGATSLMLCGGLFGVVMLRRSQKK